MILARPIVLGVTALAVLSVTASAGAQVYVDPAGNDSNAGTEAAPVQSLSAARGASTVYLKAGGAWDGSVSIRGGTWTTYGGTERALIRGTSDGFGVVSVQGDATVENLKVQGVSGTGISVMGGNNVIRNCEVDGSTGGLELGFGVMGEGNLITGNYVHDLDGMSGDTGNMNTSGGAEAYMIMASNNEIAFNSAVNCWGENATLGGAEGGCLEIVNGQGGSVIENVHFHHNYCERSVGLFEGCSGDFSGGDAIQANHGIIRNSSVSYNLAVDAMWLYLLQPVNTDFRDFIFEHNTIVHGPANENIPQRGASSFGLLVNEDAGYEFTLQPGDITVRNNIFAVVDGGASGMFSPPPSGDAYNNLFSPSAPMGANLGAGSFEADAGFTADYRLAEGSPAIDAATSDTQHTEDIDHHSVPCGSAPDIGASEYCEGSGGTTGSGGTSGEEDTGSGGADTSSAGASATDTEPAANDPASEGDGTTPDSPSNANPDSTATPASTDGTTTASTVSSGIPVPAATTGGPTTATPAGEDGAGTAAASGDTAAVGGTTAGNTMVVPAQQDSGCGCATAGASRMQLGAMLSALLGMLLLGSRRRRSPAR